MANLSVSYCGLVLANPIIAASSGLTETVQNIKELEEAGIGAVVLKSIFEEEILMEMEQTQQQMVGKSHIYPETINYMDEQPKEDLVQKFLRLISESKQSVNIPIIASINCVSNQKWTYLASEIEKAGADAIELNIFSLPSHLTMSANEISDTYLTLVKDIVNLVNIPVTVKISHYYAAMGQMISKLKDTGIKGIVLFNRYYLPDIDINTEKISGAFILSSPADIAIPLRWIALMSKTVPIDYSATSGVHSGESIIKALLAGASTVQIASVIYKNGMSSINEMKKFILKWMDNKNHMFISDFKGKLAFNSDTDPASWERVQFMREFRHFIK